MANAFLLKPLVPTAFSANATALGAPENVGTDFAGIIWRSSNGDVATLQFDLGANRALDTIMLFGIEGANIGTASVVVNLATQAQGSAFNGSNTGSGTGAGNYWSQTIPLLASANLPTSGKGVMLWMRPDTSPPPAANRHVLLTFTGLGASFFIQIARAVIGARIQPGRNFSYDAARGTRDLGSLDFSARGALLRRRAVKLRTISLTFSSLYKDEVETQTARLMEQIGNTEMIALVTDPAEHAERQSRSYFGPLVGDLSHTWRNAAAWEAKISLVSQF